MRSSRTPGTMEGGLVSCGTWILRYRKLRETKNSNTLISFPKIQVIKKLSDDTLLTVLCGEILQQADAYGLYNEGEVGTEDK
jgi:hypothetical protein